MSRFSDVVAAAASIDPMPLPVVDGRRIDTQAPKVLDIVYGGPNGALPKAAGACRGANRMPPTNTRTKHQSLNPNATVRHPEDGASGALVIGVQQIVAVPLARFTAVAIGFATLVLPIINFVGVTLIGAVVIVFGCHNATRSEEDTADQCIKR